MQTRKTIASSKIRNYQYHLAEMAVAVAFPYEGVAEEVV